MAGAQAGRASRPLTPSPPRPRADRYRRPGDHPGRSLGHLRPRTSRRRRPGRQRPGRRAPRSPRPGPAAAPLACGPRLLRRAPAVARRVPPGLDHLGPSRTCPGTTPSCGSPTSTADGHAGRPAQPDRRRTTRRVGHPAPLVSRRACCTTSRTAPAGGISTTRPGRPCAPSTPSSAGRTGCSATPPTGSCPMAGWWPSGPRRPGPPRAASPDGRASRRTCPFPTMTSCSPPDGAVSPSPPRRPRPPAVVRLDLRRGRSSVLRRSREVPIDEAAISAPDAVEFPTGGGEIAHALFYPPRHPGLRRARRRAAPADRDHPRRPDVQRHVPVFNLSVQYWTSRGFAVADVDYRGSTGYGTAYRRRLNGAWGIVDVEDCAHVVGWLAGRGPGGRAPGGHPGRQRRRVHDAGRAGVHRHLRGRGQPLRRGRPRAAGPRHPQVRVPLPRRAGRPVAGGRRRVPATLTHPPRRRRSPARSSCSRAWRTPSSRRPSPS